MTAQAPPSVPRWLPWLLAALAACLTVAQWMLGTQPAGYALLALGVAAGLSALLLALRRMGTWGQLSVSILCSLALAEFLVPIVVGSPASATQLVHDPGYWSRGTLGNQPNPGSFRVVKTTAAGEAIYDVRYTVGKDHFRVTPAPPGATRRVNFLGCSVTYGEGLQDDQTLPAYFASQVSQVDARNMAFHGYGPQQALALLQGERNTDGQVNVFLTAPWHALRSACKPSWTLGSPRFVLTPDGQGVRRAGWCGDAGGWMPLSVARALSQSALVRTGRELLLARPSDADMALYLAMVREMARVSHQRGQRFVVAFLKADESFFQHTGYSNQRLAAAIAAHADQVVDITLADRAEAMERRHYLHDLDRHPSAEANRERARILASRLKPYLSDGSASRPPSTD